MFIRVDEDNFKLEETELFELSEKKLKKLMLTQCSDHNYNLGVRGIEMSKK